MNFSRRVPLPVVSVALFSTGSAESRRVGLPVALVWGSAQPLPSDWWPTFANAGTSRRLAASTAQAEAIVVYIKTLT